MGAALALLALAQALGAWIFVRGFFPLSVPPAGHAPGPDVGGERFDRLAFVVVDALRNDLAFGPRSDMPFTQSLVLDGHALPYVAVAQSPTVTLPRLKAMLTGANPSFLDAVVNIAEDAGGAVLADTDTWLWQIRHNSQTPKKLAFAGDDTWLRLFPRDWFAWSEGVSSFFVTDTEIVDHNVTRHLPDLLDEPATSAQGPGPPDWHVLILHYLGLDHVGHTGGSSSPMMAPKQREMDDVVRRVFTRLQDRDAADGLKSLLVVVGDHGMTDEGNHGGSSPAETSAALLLASPGFALDRDAALQRLHAAAAGRRPQLINQVDIVPTIATLFGVGLPRGSSGVVIADVVRAAFGEPALAAALRRNLIQALYAAQARILTSFSGFDHRLMLAGIVVLCLAAAGAVLEAWRATQLQGKAGPARFVLLATLLYLASFGATSFIEEEHDIFWYCFASLQLIRSAGRPRHARRHLISALVGRILWSWSPNGQKGGSDLSITQKLGTSAQYLVAVDALVLPMLWRSLPPFPSWQDHVLSGVAIAASAVTVTPLGGLFGQLWRPRTVYISSAVLVIANKLGRRHAPLSQLGVFLTLRSLTRTRHLLPLYASHFLPLLDFSADDGELVSAWSTVAMMKCVFFAMGGSNSLATVDLKNAFNGVSSYSIPAVPVLTFLSNFAGPIAVCLASHRRSRSAFVYRTAFFSLHLVAICASATFFAEHLFVFTVFSPAVLYAFVWSFLVHWTVGLYVACMH